MSILMCSFSCVQLVLPSCCLTNVFPFVTSCCSSIKGVELQNKFKLFTVHVLVSHILYVSGLNDQFELTSAPGTCLWPVLIQVNQQRARSAHPVPVACRHNQLVKWDQSCGTQIPIHWGMGGLQVMKTMRMVASKAVMKSEVVHGVKSVNPVFLWRSLVCHLWVLCIGAPRLRVGRSTAVSFQGGCVHVGEL